METNINDLISDYVDEKDIALIDKNEEDRRKQTSTYKRYYNGISKIMSDKEREIAKKIRELYELQQREHYIRSILVKDFGLIEGYSMYTYTGSLAYHDIRNGLDKIKNLRDEVIIKEKGAN